ncbi:MAG: CapA family protein [Bdellovibrio sp.]
MKSPILYFIFLFSSVALAYEKANENTEMLYATSCDTRDNLATVSFVGDILVHKALYVTVLKESQHFNQLWKRTEVLINKADFSVGNLEGPAALGINSRGQDVGDIGFVYDGDVYSGTNFLFNYHPRILQDLKNSGWDLLTVANNHAYDRHSIGIDKTIAAARQVGIPTVGTRVSQERNGAFYKIANIKNIRIAFLGCTEMSNKKPDNKDQLLFCYTPETVSMVKEIASRSDVDATVVLTHWGTEYVDQPDSQQQSYARKYLEAGATAVVGSHPHVMQPWQKYITKDGRETFIAYSLGNFIAGQRGLARQTGAVIYVGLSKEGNNKAKIFGVGYTPTYRSGAEVYPVGKSNSNEAIKHTAGLFGARYRLEPETTLLPLLCNKNR